MITYFEVEKESRKCVLRSDEKPFLGYEGENNANTLVFEFKEDFVDGMGLLNIKRGEEYGYVEVDKVNETYQFPVKSSILSRVGDVEFQLVITQTDGKVYKFDPFVMNVKDAIDTDCEMPEEYPSWVDMANAKLSEVDEAIKNVETATQNATDIANELLEAKEKGEFNGKDGVSPTVSTKQTDTGAEITITDVDGSHTVTLLNGRDGEGGGIANETDPIYTADKPILALKSEIPTALSELNNDKGFITEYTETDPLYSADKSKLALKTELPTKLSDLTNDTEFMTSYTETDPTVPAHVKAITETDITNWNNKNGGITKKVLFEGEGQVSTTITFNDSVENYDYVLVEVWINSGATIPATVITQLMPVASYKDSSSEYGIYGATGVGITLTQFRDTGTYCSFRTNLKNTEMVVGTIKQQSGGSLTGYVKSVTGFKY